MHNKFRNVIEFMSLSQCRLSLQKIFELDIFLHSQYPPLTPTNIPSRRELFIRSAKLPALYFVWYNVQHNLFIFLFSYNIKFSFLFFSNFSWSPRNISGNPRVPWRMHTLGIACLYTCM